MTALILTFMVMPSKEVVSISVTFETTMVRLIRRASSSTTAPCPGAAGPEVRGSLKVYGHTVVKPVARFDSFLG